jgi:hypothetical protein
MGIATGGLSEAVRPALSKTWQNNMDQAGNLGLAGPLAMMNQKAPEAPKPLTIAPPPPQAPAAQESNKSSLLAIQNVQQQNSNAGLNTGYLVN